MTILDRYILRSFLKTFFLWLFCFIGIYVIFDLFTKMDGFMKSGRGVVGVLELVGKYYLIQSLPFLDKISPLLCLTSAMITISMLMRQNELTPILAAGISQARIIRPILIAVFIFVLFSAANREMLLPVFMNDINKEPSGYVNETGENVNASTDYRSLITIKGDTAFYSERRISLPSFDLHDNNIAVYGKNLSAENAIYLPAQDGHPAGFLMKKVTKPKEILTSETLKINEKPVIITPKDASWLEPDDCFVVTNIPFGYLASNYSWRQNASTLDFISAIRGQSLDIGMDIESSIHNRVVQPMLDMTLIFLGLPIILAKSERNVFKAMGVVALVAFSFVVVQYSSQFVGRSFASPVLGAWFPLMIFVPIAAHLYRKMLQI
ncbi:MAG: LptF/LptG family permease [Thermoguttaceae bacterium]